jgi:ATP-binding cassette subfamily B protein
MVVLAKAKQSLNLAKVQSLFSPLMLALIGISNLVVIYFGGLMYIEGTIKVSVQSPNLFCMSTCLLGL